MRRPTVPIALLVLTLSGCGSSGEQRSAGSGTDVSTAAETTAAETTAAETTAAETTAADGTTSAESCDYPCQNGGVCEVVGGQDHCNCPPNTAGGACDTVCTLKAVGISGCSSVFAPGTWWAWDGGCQQWLTFEYAAEPGVTSVLVHAFGADGYHRIGTLADGTGSGIFAGSILVPGDTEGAYAFQLNGGDFVGDPANPVKGSDGVSSPFTAPPCGQDADPLKCHQALGDGSVDFSCDGSTTTACTGSGESCPFGCIADLWLGFSLARPAVVGGLRFRADWWNKRPEKWELWAGDRPEETPGQGARLIASGAAHAAPWQCVAGEQCDQATPTECCPAGPTGTQSVDEGALISKWDDFDFDAVEAQYFYLQVSNTQAPDALYLQSVELLGQTCPESGGTYPAPMCQLHVSGPDGGCPASEWCAPWVEEPLTHGCITAGSALPNESCSSVADCAAGLDCQGGRCRTICDPKSSTNACELERPICSQVVSGSVSAAFGYCTTKACEFPFADGQCPTGLWCEPRSVGGQVCALGGPATVGQPCSSSVRCADYHSCVAGICEAYCSSTDYPHTVDCGMGAACAAVKAFPAVGLCRTPCEYDDDPSACADGQFCFLEEFGAFQTDVCRSITWDDSEPFEACSAIGELCGPASVCLNVDASNALCMPVCRLTTAPPGLDHPDCPPDTECRDILTSDALALCVP